VVVDSARPPRASLGIQTARPEHPGCRRTHHQLRTPPIHKTATGLALGRVQEEIFAPNRRTDPEQTYNLNRDVLDLCGADGQLIGLQQNVDMRRISAGAGTAAVATMVAGVWGMNLENWPEPSC